MPLIQRRLPLRAAAIFRAATPVVSPLPLFLLLCLMAATRASAAVAAAIFVIADVDVDSLRCYA